MTIIEKLAFAVLALAQKEKSRQVKIDVLLPGQRPERLGDILMEVGEELLSHEPHPSILGQEPREFIEEIRKALTKIDAVSKPSSIIL